MSYLGSGEARDTLTISRASLEGGYMSEDEGVKEVSEAVTPSTPPVDDNGKDFYDDIPEPKEDAQEVEEVGEESESPEEGDEQSKKGAQARIRELNSKYKEEKTRAERLDEQIAKLTGQNQSPQFQEDLLQQREQYESGEITAEELEQRILAKAQRLTEFAMERDKHVRRVNEEAVQVMQLHPELDPDSEAFDQDLSDSITQAGLAYVQQNPTASLKDYVNKLMKPYKRSVTNRVGEIADTVTRQAAEKALRPASTPKGDKRIEDMSEKELEDKLGIVY
jgi:hypothetical protein